MGGRNKGNRPSYLRSRPGIARQTAIMRFTENASPGHEHQTHGRLRGFRHPAYVLTDMKFNDEAGERKTGWGADLPATPYNKFDGSGNNTQFYDKYNKIKILFIKSTVHVMSKKKIDIANCRRIKSKLLRGLYIKRLYCSSNHSKEDSHEKWR